MVVFGKHGYRSRNMCLKVCTLGKHQKDGETESVGREQSQNPWGRRRDREKRKWSLGGVTVCQMLWLPAHRWCEWLMGHGKEVSGKLHVYVLGKVLTFTYI